MTQDSLTLRTEGTPPSLAESRIGNVASTDAKKTSDPGGAPISEEPMGDFLAELYDRFHQEEQARIRAAEDSARGILAQGDAAVRDRLRAAGSVNRRDWVLQPENDARADAAGVVFAAYVNALWRQTGGASTERIHDFVAKVDKLIEPVLTRYGWEGRDLIDELRGQCQATASLVHSMLPMSTASTMSSMVDSQAGSTQESNDPAGGPIEGPDVAGQWEAEGGKSSDADRAVGAVQPAEILRFFDSWRKRSRSRTDLEAICARLRGNGPEAGRQEELLKDARLWAEAALRELVTEVQNVFELKNRVGKQTFDKFVRDPRDFLPGYRKFESALWEEGWPSLEDLAIDAFREPAASAAIGTVNDTHIRLTGSEANTGSTAGEVEPADSNNSHRPRDSGAADTIDQSSDVCLAAALRVFESNPDFASAQVWMRDRMSRLASALTAKGQYFGSSARAKFALSCYNIRAAAFCRLIATIEAQSAFITMLDVFGGAAWQEFVGGIPTEVRPGSPSIANGITRRKRWWTRWGYQRLAKSIAKSETAVVETRNQVRTPNLARGDATESAAGGRRGAASPESKTADSAGQMSINSDGSGTPADNMDGTSAPRMRRETKGGRPPKDQTRNIHAEWIKLDRPEITWTICDKIAKIFFAEELKGIEGRSPQRKKVRERVRQAIQRYERRVTT
jgi:hypothetical protein